MVTFQLFQSGWDAESFQGGSILQAHGHLGAEPLLAASFRAALSMSGVWAQGSDLCIVLRGRCPAPWVTPQCTSLCSFVSAEEVMALTRQGKAAKFTAVKANLLQVGFGCRA